jgi:hypothetical protein
MPDEKAEAVATYTARGRRDAPAALRHGSLIVHSSNSTALAPAIHSIVRAKARSFPSPRRTPAS